MHSGIRAFILRRFPDAPTGWLLLFVVAVIAGSGGYAIGSAFGSPIAPGFEFTNATSTIQASGAWKVPASEFAKHADPAAIQMKIEDMNFSTSLMNDFAKDIAASKYKTADEAAKDIRQRTDVALMKHVAERQAGAATAPGATTQPTAAPSTKPQ
jgi:hypothetical protein